jgi:hypothetical protein
MRSHNAVVTRISKYKLLKMIDCLVRDTAKSAQLNIDDDAIHRLHARIAKFGASFSVTEELALPSEVRSKSAYYSVIARAVSRLPNNTREARQALYDRAEIALAAELLHDAKISDERAGDERLALERAIRKIEGDARRRENPKKLQQTHQRPITSFVTFFRIFKRNYWMA